MTKREIILTILLIASIFIGWYLSLPETIIKKERDYKYEDLLIRQNNDLSNKIDRLEKENEKLERKYADSKAREKNNLTTHENNLSFIDSSDTRIQDSILRANIAFLRTVR